MLIGHTEESKTENGRTEATASFLTTVDCTVQYGDWAKYHYCQFSNENYPYVRVEAGLFNDAYSNPRYGNPVGADGTTKVNKDNHDPNTSHKEGEDCTLPVYFHQLYGGGQGCYGGNGHIGDGVTEITNVTATEKFTAKIPQGMTLIAGHTYTLGELFAASGNGEEIQNLSVNAYVSPVSVENVGNVSGTFVRENNWADSTLTLNGSGAATITISDYYYSVPVTITVNVGKLASGMFQQVSEIKNNGKYVIVAELDGVYYALGNVHNDDKNNSIDAVVVPVLGGVVTESDAPTWTVIEQDGQIVLEYEGKYLYCTAGDTDLKLSNNAFTFQLTEENGAFRLGSGSRAIAYRGSEYDCFRFYSTTNVNAKGYAFDLYFFEQVSCLHENTENREGQDATCTENGYEPGVYCQECGACISGGKVIAAIGHNYTSKVTTAAGCETTGEKTYTCSNCGDSYTESIEAIGHNYTSEVTTAAGCETTGEKTYTCTECGETTTETIPATGHVNITTTTVDATCGKNGSITDTCSCGKIVSTETIPATGEHTYDNDADAECNVCGHIREIETEPSVKEGWYLVTDVNELKVGDTIIIVAKDYNYALSTTQNNNNRGQASYNKTGDPGNAVQKLTLQAGTTSGTFALYTGSGYLYAASSSGNYLRTQTTNDANGSWKITIAADGTATIKAQGSYGRNVMQYNQSSSLFACYSSASQKALVIYKYVKGSTGGGDEHTHSYTEQITAAATCTADGVKTFTCSCGDFYTKPIAALGHTTENGTCERCGNVIGGTTPHEEKLTIKGTTGTKDGTNSIWWKSGDVTFTNNKDTSSTAIRNSDSNHYRAYVGSDLVITVNGGTISKIVITCDGTSYMGLEGIDNNVQITTSGNVITITLKEPTASVTLNVTKQTRPTQVVVTYTK